MSTLGSSTQSRDRGIGIQLTLSALLLGTAVTTVTGDLLDFESLPYPTTTASSTGGTVFDPFSSHMGFRFSAENFYPPGSSSPYVNVWTDYALTSTPYYGTGHPYGINGERALGVSIYSSGYVSEATHSIEREDGGEWKFGGAQFSPVVFAAADGSTLRIAGWHEGVEVYNISTFLVAMEQVSFGAQVDALTVDRVVITYQRMYPSGAQLSTWFTMDDMHYELVPAPGALVLLSVCGLLRQRRRA